MARTPAAEKAATKAPKKTGAVNKYDEELAQFAQQYATMEDGATGSLPFISTKGGRLTFNGGEVPEGRMNVIVLDHILENHYYADAYDPDNPSSPVCFAFGRKDEEMEPHEKSSEPQCETCKGCPMNEFGSADRGRGKACKNIRRLALITEDELENVEDAQVAYLKVSVTSVKAWAGYVQQLAKVMNIPPFAAVTEVSIIPDPKSQFKLQFKLVEQITDKAIIKELIAKRGSIQQELVTPYQAYEPQEEEERPRRGGAKKPAARGRQQERDSNPPDRPGRGGAAKPAARGAKPAARGGRKF